MADVTIPRARFEAMVRQTLALREQLDSLTLLMQSEISATDPRKDSARASTFGRTA